MAENRPARYTYPMHIVDSLIAAGLSDKAASVYVATLDLGQASVQAIAQQAGLKRPTAYLILEDLERQGLVRGVKLARGQGYAATNPEHLVATLKQREQAVSQILPELVARYHGPEVGPRVASFSGAGAVTQLQALLAASPEVRSFGSLSQLLEQLELWPKLAKHWKSTGGSLQEIVPDDITLRDRAVTTTKDKWHEVRFVPGESPSRISVWVGESVLLLSPGSELQLVVLTDAALATSHETLFTLAWLSALPLGQ
jgi:predicted transcriptional regulator